MASSETVPAAGHKPRGVRSFLRSQMRNIAPFLTLILLSAFFAFAFIVDVLRRLTRPR